MWPTAAVALRYPSYLLPEARYWIGAAGSRSTRSCRWARCASVSASTNGSAAHRQEPDPASANRRVGLHETHPLFAACRHPAVRQRPRGCAEAEVEECQGDLVYQHELLNVPG